MSTQQIGASAFDQPANDEPWQGIVAQRIATGSPCSTSPMALESNDENRARL